ncbi:hypothetical protein [Tenacibaculum sp.]|uniref:hypothetical protein n=1 Tax=Tenacibaculum sp. TaxID=1906242 RepID=UPI003AA8CBCB
MKNYIATLVLISICALGFGQESFKKVYEIPNTITYCNGPNITLKKVSKIKFKDLTDKEQDSIRAIYPLGSKLNYEIEKNIFGKKIKVFDTTTIDEKFYSRQVIEKKRTLQEMELKGL